MSDPTIEEDSLISQDDIDKLLESSPIGKAQDKSADDDDIEDELGELSQDDIDSLMNSNLAVEDDPLDVLNKLDEPDTEATEDGEMELISQDDIDQLMNSNLATEDKILSDPDDSEEFEELSKDDIKALMGDQNSEIETKILKESPSEGRMSIDEDILKDEIIEIVPSSARKKRIKEDDFIISESEAVGVADCLISQKTIDGLIKNFDTDSDPDPVILDEDFQMEPGSESIPEPDMVNTAANTSGDSEDFLKPVSDVEELDLNDDRGDVTQEDIDALLSEPDEEEEAQDDILISQDDIDTLLMAADQEDEDVLGDLIDKGLEGSLDNSLDEDILDQVTSDETQKDEDDDEEEAEDEEDEEENEDQVVLQGDDEVIVKPKKKKKKAGTPWYKKKLVIASLSALVILGITVPITYFLFFKDEQKVQEVVSAPQKPEVVIQKEIKVETVEPQVKQPVESKNPGHMVLKDFVILAPDAIKNMTYVMADISIDYADQKAFDEIQNNLPYFRGLIYDSINKSLTIENQNKITETEILFVVEAALKKVLPVNSISRVGFLSFKIS